MDSLNRVREMRCPDGGDLGVARAALESAIAASGPGRRQAVSGRTMVGAGVGLGMVALAAIVATSMNGMPAPGEPVSPPISETMQDDPRSDVELVSASTILTDAAEVQIGVHDAPLAEGQFLRSHVVTDDFMFLSPGWESEADPFTASSAADAIAAVRYRNEETVYRPADPTADITHESVDFRGVEAFGDTAAADKAWAEFYGRFDDVAPIGGEPGRSVWRTSPDGAGADMPTSPDAVFEYWQAQLPPEASVDEEHWVDVLWGTLGSVEFANASGESRAATLNALASLGGAETVSIDDGIAVIRHESTWLTMQVTIDTAAGQVTQVQTAFKKTTVLADDGTATVIDVVRPPFLPEGTFDRVETITQDVVDSAPETDMYDD